MSPGVGGAICDAPPMLWPPLAPSANATRHRQQRRWQERSVATISSYHTSYDERPVEPNPFEPRTLEVRRSLEIRATRSTEQTTSCAIRAPRRTTKGLSPKLCG